MKVVTTAMGLLIAIGLCSTLESAGIRMSMWQWWAIVALMGAFGGVCMYEGHAQGGSDA